MKSSVITVMEVMQASDSRRKEGESLPRGRVARVAARPGRRLVCTGGRLWLTRTADPMDYILEQGQSLELDRETLVSALAESAYRLD